MPLLFGLHSGPAEVSRIFQMYFSHFDGFSMVIVYKAQENKHSNKDIIKAVYVPAFRITFYLFIGFKTFETDFSRTMACSIHGVS